MKKISINELHEEKKRSIWSEERSIYKKNINKVLPFEFRMYENADFCSEIPESIIKPLYKNFLRYYFPITEFSYTSRYRVNKNGFSAVFTRYNPDIFSASSQSSFPTCKSAIGYLPDYCDFPLEIEGSISVGLLLNDAIVYEDPLIKIFEWDDTPPDPDWRTYGKKIFKKFHKEKIKSIKNDENKFLKFQQAINLNAKLDQLIEDSTVVPVCISHPFMVLIDRDEDDDGDCIMPKNFMSEIAITLAYEGSDFSEIFPDILKKQFKVGDYNDRSKVDKKIDVDFFKKTAKNIVFTEHFPGEYVLMLEASEDSKQQFRVMSKYVKDIAKKQEVDMLENFLLKSTFSVNGNAMTPSEAITLRNDDEFIRELRSIVSAASSIYKFHKKTDQKEQVEILRERLIKWGSDVENSKKKSNFYQNLFIPSSDAFFAGAGAAVTGLATGEPLVGLMAGALGAISPNLLQTPKYLANASGDREETVAVSKFICALTAARASA